MNTDKTKNYANITKLTYKIRNHNFCSKLTFTRRSGRQSSRVHLK